MSINPNKATPVAENDTVADTSVETPVNETEGTDEAKQVGAPVGTSNETIADLLPEERISRSKALNIVRGQDLKCSQERMTKIMEDKYGPAPTKDERDAVNAAKKAEKKEAADKVKAEKAEVRAAAKAEKAEKVAADKAEKAKIAEETKAKREAAKAANAANADKPAV